MNRFVKWILIACSGFLLLLIAAVILVPLLVDVNQFKPQIESRVREATGRAFQIGGPIELSVFPWVGLSVRDVALGNPGGFKEPGIASVDRFEARVKLIPLIAGNVEIKRVVLDAPKIVLVKNKDGRTNWTFDLSKAKAPTPKPPKETGTGDSRFALKSLSAEEIAIRKGTLTYVDHSKGSQEEITALDLTLTDVSLDRPVAIEFAARYNNQPISLTGRMGPLGNPPVSQPLNLDLKLGAFDTLKATVSGTVQELKSKPIADLRLAVADFSPRQLLERLGTPLPVQPADPKVLDRLSLSAHLQGGAASVTLKDGVLILDDTRADFNVAASELDRPNLKLDIKMDNIDIDRYLPAPSSGSGTSGSGPATSKAAATDYTPLRRMVLDGKVRIAALKAHNARLKDVHLDVKGQNGVFKIAPLAAALYDGSVNLAGAFDVRGSQPRSDLQLKLERVNVGPLLQDVARKDVLEGILQSDATLQFEGDDPSRIKQSLGGSGQLRFTDGAIVGIDLAAMVRNVQAAFGNGAQVTEKPKTDFSELTVPFSLARGVFQTPDTRLLSPLLRVAASGQADLVQETLDFRVQPKFVATIKGQGDATEYAGVTVPVIVDGSFQKPRFQPDLKAVAQQQMEKKVFDSKPVRKALEKNPELKPLEEGAKDLLKNVLK